MYIQVKDGGKNLQVQISGFLSKDIEKPVCILDLDDSSVTKPREGIKGLRFDAALWALQEKMGFYLWWEEAMEPKDLAIVMESRNSMRFDVGLNSPRIDKGWGKKLWLTSFKVDEAKGFFLILDFDKQ